jgi:hypothetical protein
LFGLKPRYGGVQALTDGFPRHGHSGRKLRLAPGESL